MGSFSCRYVKGSKKGSWERGKQSEGLVSHLMGSCVLLQVSPRQQRPSHPVLAAARADGEKLLKGFLVLGWFPGRL